MVFVGEAPGPDEVSRGRPFVGRAGLVFNLALKAAGIDRKLVYITNTVKCMPPRPGQPNTFRKPTRREIEFCGERHLREELGGDARNVVVTLGDVPFQYLTQSKGQITDWRGWLLEVAEVE